MANEKVEKKMKKVSFSKEGDLVVKNKKFKRSDILAFCICLVAAFVIWLYAANVEINKERDFERMQNDLPITSEQ